MIPNFREKLSDWGQKIEKGVQTLKETAISAKEHLKAKLDEQGNKTTKNVEKPNTNSNDIGSTNQRVWNNSTSSREVSNTLGLTALAGTVGRAFENTSKEKNPNEIPTNFNNHTVKYSNSSSQLSENEIFLNYGAPPPPPTTTKPQEEIKPSHNESQFMPQTKPNPAQELLQPPLNRNTIISPEISVSKLSENLPQVGNTAIEKLPLNQQKEKLKKLLTMRNELSLQGKHTHLDVARKERIQAGLDKLNSEIANISKPLAQAMNTPQKREEYLQAFGPSLFKSATLEALKSMSPRESIVVLIHADQAGCSITRDELKNARPNDFDNYLSQIALEAFQNPRGTQLVRCINLGIISANTKINGFTLLEKISNKDNIFNVSQVKQIKEALKEQNPEAFLEAKVALYMRAAGHTLSLSGQAMEGYNTNFFLFKMNKLNSKLSDSGQVGEGRMKVLNQVFNSRSTGKNQTVEEITAKILRDEPLLVSTGYRSSVGGYGHSMSVVIWGDKLVICNRGGGSSGKPLEIYKFNTDKLNENVIRKILSYQNGEESFKNFMKDLKQELECTSSVSDRQLEAFAKNQVPMQSVGNCTYANLRAGMFALGLLEAERKNPNLAQDSSTLNVLAQENRQLERFYSDHFIEKFNNKVSQLKTDHQMGNDIERVRKASEKGLITIEKRLVSTVDKKEEAKNLKEAFKKLKNDRPDIHEQVLNDFKNRTGFTTPIVVLAKYENGLNVTPQQVEAYNVLRELVANHQTTDIEKVQKASTEPLNTNIDIKVEAKNLREILSKLKNDGPDIHAQILADFKKTGFSSTVVLLRVENGTATPAQADAYKVLKQLILDGIPASKSDS